MSNSIEWGLHLTMGWYRREHYPELRGVRVIDLPEVLVVCNVPLEQPKDEGRSAALCIPNSQTQ